MSLRGAKVGDELFIVARGNAARVPRAPWRKTVTHIGRKWITVGEGYQAARYDMDSGYEDGRGYSCDSQAYLHEDEYRNETMRGDLWRQIRRFVGDAHVTPKHLSVKAMRAVLASLSDAAESTMTAVREQQEARGYGRNKSLERDE